MSAILELNAAQDTRKRLSATEVRRPDDSLQLVHHATRETRFRVAEMAPFSHFGTRTAAKQRIFDQDGARLISGFLDIRNPLHVDDMHGNHDVRSVLNLIAFSNADAAISPWREEILAAEEESGEGFDHLAKRLIDAGWDGLRYVNLHEDPGSISWVILDPSQVLLVRDGPAAECVDPWELTAEEFVGPAIVMDHFDIDGGEDMYYHLWDELEEEGQLLPILARDSEGWEARWLDDWDSEGNLGLYDPTGTARGFYLAGQAWIDEDARGAGRSALLINAAADLMGGSPTRNLYGNGFSPAGYTAHVSAHRRICQWARENGYRPAEDLAGRQPGP